MTTMIMTTMITTPIATPEVASRDEWLAARKELLLREKELTRQKDAQAAARRRLPMVRLNKEYAFEGPEGKRRLVDLFEGRRQLILYHFMFDPKWEKGCLGCTGYVNALGDLSTLGERDTSFVLVARAPLEKLEAYRALQGWTYPWYSSFDSDFNYDFHVTLDENVAPIEYNYRDKAEMERRNGGPVRGGEMPGLSVFFRSDDDTVFHTYSTYARGGETLTDTYSLLDMTPYGRQEDWEDSPPGWPQKPTYG
jgi:predicted dithiol-disulfide oxidoreductase (DUF899 family)